MKNKIKKYFSMVKDTETKSADIYIYGDITSWPWEENDVSSYTLSKQLQVLDNDVEEINIYINSYGGEVAEGMAIYNALKRHKAKINTYSDGFACSIASVIFMAGDNRYMSNTSLLMIHNAWTRVSGNADDLRKQADDLEEITQLSINAYMDKISIEENELREMLMKETWINSDIALEKGFITEILSETKENKPAQSIKESVFQMFDGNKRSVQVNIDSEEIVQKLLDKLEQKYNLSSKVQNKKLEDNQELKLGEFLIKAFFNEKK